jgi:hypothetical protein
MTEKKSLVEEAILQMKNLEEAVAENAKGILASTMRQEIKDLVKESLKEQDDEEIEDEEGDEMDMEDDEMNIEDDEMEMEDDEMDIEDDEMGMEEDEMDMSEPNMEVDTIDLTNQPTSQVLKVFKLLSPEDEIVVTKDNAGNINLKDNEKEYMIVGEGIDEFDEDIYEMDGIGMYETDEFDEMDLEEEMYEMDDIYEMNDMYEMNTKDIKFAFGNEFDDEIGEGTIYEVEIEESKDEDWSPMDEEEGFEMGDFQLEEDDEFDEAELYEMDDVDLSDFELEEYESDDLMEAKKSRKPKGMGMGSASKFKYDSKPNMSGGFKEKMKQGPRSVGTGKVPKDLYKDSPSFDGEFNKKPTKSKDVKGGMMTKPKKVETKEASRTLGSGSNFRRGGLPKPKAHSKFNANIDESVDTQELNLLREKNEEYRKALNIFRTKLNEVAIFNSNLAYATRLFTEHSTSKQEKVNILKRFDGVETLKESKNLYKVIKDELSHTKTQQVNESVERTIQKSPSTGSAINLIESKTYENPQFLRMKDLMSKLK